MTPAMTGASSSAIAAAVATPIRKSTSSRRRGTAGRRRTGAPTELTHAYEGAAAGDVGLVAPARLGRREPWSAETANVGPKGLDLIGQLADDVGELGVGLPAVRRLLGRGHAAGPSSFIASIASRAFAWTRARRSSSVSTTSGSAGASGCRAAASLRRSSSAGSAAGSRTISSAAGPGGAGRSTGEGEAFRLDSMRPSAAMPTIPASQARERFTRAMVSRAAVGQGRKSAATLVPNRQLPYIALPASPRPGHSQLVLAGEAA